MNDLIDEITQNLPKPSDFGVGSNEYRLWEKEIERLGQVPEEYNYIGNFLGAVALLVGLALINSLAPIAILLMAGGFGAMVGGRSYTDGYESVRSEIQELKSKKNIVDSKYWSAKRKYIDESLSRYKDAHLYRKRSDSYDFAERLQIFSDAAEHFLASSHIDYVASRNVKVTPYKRPAQLSVNKSKEDIDKASNHSHQTNQETMEGSMVSNDIHLQLEDTHNIPVQEVGGRVVGNNDRSPSTYTYDEEQAKINTLVGNTGEEMVASYEKNLLIQSGNSELADRVEIVAKTMGDGMGYDVLSFDQSGKEKFIEVKATRSNGVNANFTFTSNELDFLATYPNSAFVYCVFAISSDNPRLKIYPAKQFLDGVFEPMEYRVSVF